jgi:hypothetical protein
LSAAQTRLCTHGNRPKGSVNVSIPCPWGQSTFRTSRFRMIDRVEAFQCRLPFPLFVKPSSATQGCVSRCGKASMTHGTVIPGAAETARKFPDEG